MKTIAGSALVLCASVWMATSVAAQTPVGALAIDERQGDQYGWAVDYATAGTAQAAALRECGGGCSVVEVQEGLLAAGFDPGGADGMFGPRTRSAIRRWQTSRGERATGYLDGASVATSCWMEISARPGCHVWNVGYAVGATVTWTGECSGGLARGTGSLRWVWDGNVQVDTGQLQDGRMNGRWVWRRGAGSNEGPMVDGEQYGHWVIRDSDGDVAEGPIVNGERSGRWVIRYADGQVDEGPYVAGEQHGHWVFRFADGQVDEGSMVNGERHGDWIVRFTSGRTVVERWVHGELVETR